jgi:hypothetical protein
MKDFRCHICQKYLGCMEKGKIRRETVLICKECFGCGGDGQPHDNRHSFLKDDMPEFIKDLLDGRKTK